jgi:hypothetical protein
METPVYSVCNATYQEGAQSGGPMCACGTFAIGVCQECGEPRCGSCSVMAEGRRVCVTHVVERRDRALAEQERRRSAEEAAERDRRSSHEAERHDAIRSIEALVVAMHAAGSPGSVKMRRFGERRLGRPLRGWWIGSASVWYAGTGPNSWSEGSTAETRHHDVGITTACEWVQAAGAGKNRRSVVTPAGQFLHEGVDRGDFKAERLDVISCLATLRRICEQHGVTATG